MAYDKDGNFYLDPTDYEDQQAVQERYQERQKQGQIDAYLNRQLEADQTGKAIGNIFNEAMKAEGLDDASYLELWQKDPGVKDIVKKQIRSYAKELGELKRKPRDKDGRFLSNADAARQGKVSTTPGGKPKKPTVKIEDLKKKAQGSYLSDSDESDLIDIILGGASLLD